MNLQKKSPELEIHYNKEFKFHGFLIGFGSLTLQL